MRISRTSEVRARSIAVGVTACILAALLGLVWLQEPGAADSAIVGTTAPKVAGLSAQEPYVVIVVVDAARADEVDLTKLPNLARLAAQGTVYPHAWVGQLPTITEASHATIGTGVLPRRHGIFGESWRVPGTNRMSPSLLDGYLTRTGYMGKVISRSGAPTLAGIVKQHNPADIVAALSGHKIYAADGMGAGAADFVAFGVFDGRRHFVPSAIPGRAPIQSVLDSPDLDLSTYPRVPGVEDAWTTTLATNFVATYRPRILMINLPEVDTFGHANGTNLTVMQPLMSGVDQQIGRLEAAYSAAHILSQTDWIITSDHGMVPARYTVNVRTVELIIGRAGGESLYVGHGDYCPIWLKNASAVPAVARALSRDNIPHVAAVYAKSPAGTYRLVSPAARLAYRPVQQAYADLLGGLDQSESPDIVLLYDENTMTMTPSFARVGRKGDHGGATWGAEHIPLILSGPDIRGGFSSPYPARLVDVAPTVETLLGITPTGQDGVPLADAMTRPPASAFVAQAHVNTRLAQDVRALEKEAALRPNTAKSR
jgi:arylsulfatase A-like enzyme